MNSEKLNKIAKNISKSLGITFNATVSNDPSDQLENEKRGNLVIDFRPEKPDYPHGFSFRIEFFWKRFEINFVPDNYAYQLIKDMENKKEGHILFAKMLESSDLKNEKLFMKINNQDLNLINPETWITDWKRLEIGMIKYSADLEIKNDELLEKIITVWGKIFFPLILSLMPLEEIEDIDSFNDLEGLPEGSKTRTEVNKYERNPLNRLKCIILQGAICKVCNFDFEKIFGEIGKGFIHIHHIKPVSEIGEDYRVNPINDLIPVCPNCHSMLHKKKQPYTVEEMKAIILNISNSK